MSLARTAVVDIMPLPCYPIPNQKLFGRGPDWRLEQRLPALSDRDVGICRGKPGWLVVAARGMARLQLAAESMEEVLQRPGSVEPG